MLLYVQANITIKRTLPCFSLGMGDWFEGIDEFLPDGSKTEHSANAQEVGVASESLLLSQEEIYELSEEFQDSDTELL